MSHVSSFPTPDEQDIQHALQVMGSSLLNVISNCMRTLACCAIRQHLVSLSATRCLHLNLDVSTILENLMSFTMVTAMIFTAFEASLAGDSDANQNGLGARSKARDHRYTIAGHKCSLVVQVVLAKEYRHNGQAPEAPHRSANEQRIFTLTMHIA